MKLSVSQAVDQMLGLLKTDQPALTDDEVKTMLEERRMERFPCQDFDRDFAQIELALNYRRTHTDMAYHVSSGPIPRREQRAILL